MLSNDAKYEQERKEAKYLVVKTAWFGLGLGHMGSTRRRVVGVWRASETSFVHRGVGGLERSGVLRGTFRNGFEIQRCGGKDDERTRGGKEKEAILALGALADEEYVGKGTVERGRLRKRRRAENIKKGMVRNQSIATGKK